MLVFGLLVFWVLDFGGFDVLISNFGDLGVVRRYLVVWCFWWVLARVGFWVSVSFDFGLLSVCLVLGLRFCCLCRWFGFYGVFDAFGLIMLVFIRWVCWELVFPGFPCISGFMWLLFILFAWWIWIWLFAGLPVLLVDFDLMLVIWFNDCVSSESCVFVVSELVVFVLLALVFVVGLFQL